MQQEVEAKDLDSLHKILYEGLQNETFKSELESGIEGDINVEYVIIHDSKGNEVYRDEETIHYDFWGYMEDYNLGFKIKRTPEED